MQRINALRPWPLLSPPSSLILGKNASPSGEYPKIDITKPAQTRLFHLLPGVQTEPLRCRFSVASLTESLEYYAVSYAWGQPSLEDDEYYVICGDRRLEITKNLFDFLKRHRDANDEKPLWIDAACINQYDDDEKSYQISHMGDVYSKAASVIIWLGLADEDTLPVLEHLSELKRANDAMEDQNLTPDRQMCLSFISDTDVPAFDQSIWKSLDRFYHRSWFNRVWVLQEEILAQHRVYVCGLYSFADDLIAAGIPWLRAYQTDIFTSSAAKTEHSAHSNIVVRLDWDALDAQVHQDEQHSSFSNSELGELSPSISTEQVDQHGRPEGGSKTERTDDSSIRVLKRVFLPSVTYKPCRRTVQFEFPIATSRF
jgi:hypothetical protein